MTHNLHYRCGSSLFLISMVSKLEVGFELSDEGLRRA